MHEELAKALSGWRDERPCVVDNVLMQMHCDGALGEPFQQRNKMMPRLCGVKPFGFHALRHLHASLLYNEGAELSVVQRQLRHTNPNTTARYLRSLGYEEEHSQKVLAVLEGRGRGKVIPFPQKQNPQSSRSRGEVGSLLWTSQRQN